MKKSILLFVLVSLFTWSFAVNPVVTVNDAKQTATNFLTEQCHINAASIQLTLQYTETDESGEPLYYRFQLNNQGFVIVSASELYHPILAFSYESDYEASKENDAFCSSYKENIKAAKRADAPVSAVAANEWKRYNTANFTRTKDAEVRECMPLLTTSWGQSIYYNQYCPFDGNASNAKDNRTIVGSAALAMSSIINYYRYPTQGYGGVSYIPFIDWGAFQETYPRIFLNLNNVTYNYDAMTSSINNYNGEVSKLLFHTGATALTNYSAETNNHKTRTEPFNAYNALKQYWGFSTDAQMTFRPTDVQNDSVWIADYVLPDLDARRPVFYSAYREQTMLNNMCFVVDGYKYLNSAEGSSVFLHVNLASTTTGSSEMRKAYYMYTSSNFSYKHGESVIRYLQPATLSIEKPVTSETLVTAKSGTISDGAGNMKYSSNSDRVWEIAAPNANSYTFTFKRLNTEANNDVISIYKDEVSAANLVQSFSGQYLTVAANDQTMGSAQQVSFDLPALPNSFTVNSDKVFVTFTSNDTIEDYGFVLEYSSTYDQSGISACAESQEVTYPHYVLTDDPFVSAGSLQPYTSEFEAFVADISSDDEDYPALTTCSWTIKPDPQDSYHITNGYYFKFPKFDLKAGDFIEITTISSTPELLGIFDVYNAPQSDGYTVYNNKIKVRFVTDHWMEGDGFEMEYWALVEDKINQETGISDLSVYPNPATNFVNVDLTSEAQNISVSIVDMSGKVLYNDVFSHNGGTQNYKVPVTELANGIYFLNLDTPTGKVVRKIVVR
ncbi:MAG: C10 family peptidase [Bacteroidales bacterium]|nr:C10 family peptidase [Bacteroidales bacterium]